MEKIIGIYKITSPTERIYIGQSRDIKTRFNRYFKMHKSNITQIRLWRSFKKYGVKNHKFEIVEECKFEDLNKRERYWQDNYNVLSKKGLNCILQETDNLTRQYTKECLIKRSGENHWIFGRKHSKERIRRNKISEAIRKPVLQLDLNDNVIKEYSSLTEAAKELNSHSGSISHAIQGKRVKKHKGFKWKYKE